MSKALILSGISLIILGLCWNFLARLPLGRLPGDILVEKKNVVVYIPLATSLLLSALLSLVLWWLSRK